MQKKNIKRKTTTKEKGSERENEGTSQRQRPDPSKPSREILQKKYKQTRNRG
jgi:hypothetical protein